VKRPIVAVAGVVVATAAALAMLGARGTPVVDDRRIADSVAENTADPRQPVQPVLQADVKRLEADAVDFLSDRGYAVTVDGKSVTKDLTAWAVATVGNAERIGEQRVRTQQNPGGASVLAKMPSVRDEALARRGLAQMLLRYVLLLDGKAAGLKPDEARVQALIASQAASRADAEAKFGELGGPAIASPEYAAAIREFMIGQAMKEKVLADGEGSDRDKLSTWMTNAAHEHKIEYTNLVPITDREWRELL